MLNVVLLIVCICIVLVLIIYLFYWNRLLGYIFGLLFRLYFWNQNESSVWLDLGSIHFSILGGSILLKDLRYHSSNQTIRVVKGQISWRYWIRAPAEEDDLVHAQVIGGISTLKARSPPSCRVHVKIQGLEWFIYNRTAAYDAIISAMDPPMTQMSESARPSGDGRSSLRKIFSGASVPPESSLFGHHISLLSSFYDRTPNFIKRAATWVASQLPNFDAKDLLPFSVEATTAAITLGNLSTPSLLVAEFRRAQGVFGTVPARSKHDLYRQMLSFTFENASLCLAENKKYSDTMSAKGQELHESIRTSDSHTLRQSSYVSFVFFRRLWREFRLWEILSPKHKFRLFNPHDGSWRRHKPRQPAEDSTPINAEYAKARKILETPLLELCYYVDIPGKVPMRTGVTRTADPLDIGNGDSAPEWGLDLAIVGGTIRYGPWADRQRVHLQHAFFPQAFSTGVPEPRLTPGDTRKWVALRVFVEMRDGVVLQIPFREPSKNWQWDGKAKIPERSRVREAASIHVKAGDSSTVSYTMPFVAGSTGYEPILEVHLDTITVTSSLNDIRLVTAESCRVRGQMPTPLAWNDERTWKYTVSLRQPVLYLLRDHVNMFTDLGKDWSSGPSTDNNHFVPVQYEIEVDMQNYELNTYVNDHNIIDKPLIREENSLLTLRGAQLRNGVKIPLNRYRPIDTTVTFWLNAPTLDVFMTLPRWNSHSLFPSPHRNQIGRIGHFYLDASFRYYAEVHPENIDHLKLSIDARSVVYKACGYTIRHFMILRENYFGAFTHFSTLEEYLQKRERAQPVGDPILLQYRAGSSNAMMVELDVSVESSAMIVPAGLPGYESYNVKETYNLDNIDMGACAVLVMPSLQLHLRTHDYYMEMALNIDTVVGRAVDHCSENLFSSPNSYLQGGETLAIDGISITANRLFGPQPFTATYLCLWEIHITSVNAVASVAESRILQAAGDAFGLHYIDPLNSPAAEYAVPTDPDVTFLKFCLGSANVIWYAGGAALEVALPEGLRVDSNDLAGKTYGKVTSIRVPQVSLKMLLSSPSSSSVWYEAMAMNADINLDLYSAPPGWQEKAEQQAAFLARQDSHTLRARFMYMSESRVDHDLLVSGRGMLDNELFLPQLRIPSQHYRANPSKVMKSLFPELQSDSEDDVNRSDLDYDTQLANSRPYKPFVIREDNESIPISDESDDDDLTDYSTDSDDVRTLPDHPDSWPLLADYAYWIARYTSHCLEKPTLWTQSPYMLHRECTFRSRPSLRKRKGGVEPVAIVSEKPSQTTKDITVIRFASEQGVSVWITPLVVPASEQLLKDITTHQLSPELRFDALMTRHVRSFSLTAEKFRRSTILDITLPLLDVAIAQAVSSTDANGRLDDAPVHSSRNDVLSSLVLEIHDIRTKGHIDTGLSMPSENSFTSSFALANLKLLDREASLTTRDASHATCSLKADFSSASMLGNQATLDLGRIGLEIDHSTPELLLASATSVAKCAERVADSLKGRSDLDLYRQIIFEAINFSRERTIIDPFSTIQPSFLIQSGRPHDIRTDGAFRFLIYLRNCLRYLEPNERHAVLSIQRNDEPQVSVDQLQVAIEAQMAHSDIDFQDATHKQDSILHVLVPGLGSLGASVAEVESQKRGSLETVTLQLKQFRLSIGHPNDSGYSEIYLRRIATSVSTRTALVSQTASVPQQSTASLRDKEPSNTRQVALMVSTGDIGVNVNPHLLNFLQIAIRAQRHYASSVVSSPVESPSRSHQLSFNVPPLYEVDAVISCRSLRFKAAAERLIIEYKASEVTYISTILAKHVPHSRVSWDLSMNHTLTFAEVRLQACTVGELARFKDYAVLASLAIARGRISTTLRYEPQAKPNLRGVFLIHSVHLNVPRSAMRLYRFMEEWQADYLPGLHATTKALLSELGTGRGKPRSTSSRTSTPSLFPTLDLHTSLSSLRVSLQVMHGTWLSWEISRTVAYLNALNAVRKRTYRFGVQVGSQCFSISSRTAQEIAPGIRVKLDLPTFTMTGNHDGKIVRSTALIEFFHLTVKPSHWDTLLSVQQKFGHDFQDLMAVIADSRQKKKPTMPPKLAASESKSALEYAVSFKMQGFRVGLEGHASTLFLECEDIHGEISEERQTKWRITLRDLALSLASNAKLPSHESPFDRGRRSAFVIVDCALTMQSKIPPTTKRVDFELTKMHAVMQPSSIGELGDFVDHLQAEVLVRKGKRAKELDEFREKTRRVMRTFDVKIGESHLREDEFWWDSYILNLHIENFSIVFPLTLTQELQLPRSGSTDESAVRAFLFSIRSIVFGTHRGQTGEVSMLGFSFQFVPSFKQSNPRDFSGELHRTYNRLVYPEMKAQLRTERLSTSRRVYLTADVNGFILDIDSNMPDYVHSLIDVYRQGKERVERLASTIPRSQVVADVPVSARVLPAHDEYDALLTSSVLASLTFASGKVRMHSRDASPYSSRVRSASMFKRESKDGSDERARDSAAEVFNLPVVSVWCEYRATPATSKIPGSPLAKEPSSLLFKSTIHSSQNTLRPTLLPFLTEFVGRVEDRMRKTTSRDSHASSISQDISVALQDKRTEQVSESVSSMQISLSLRIDQSKLELTCQPDVNVIAGLHWESGGFMLNISPGARRVILSGSVGGLTAGLKHGFLSEDCVKLNARNLAFSLNFSKPDDKFQTNPSSLSLVVDTEFSGGVRFSRLQDVLCFKAVWLDRIPILSSQNSIPPSAVSKATSHLSTTPASQTKQELVTAVVVRLRSIKLDVDLGQSISAVKLHLNDGIFRTKVTESVTALSLSVAKFSVDATGNLSGHIRVPDFRFQTLRSSEYNPDDSDGGRMLDLSMTSGPLNLELDSEFHKMIHYRAEPLRIMIYDDWSKLSSSIPAAERRVRLAFVVSGTEVMAMMNVGTIPKLVSYATKFKINLEVQKEGASRESKAFRMATAPRYDNLSAVANAMLTTARSRIKEAGNTFAYAVAQCLSLKVDVLQLVVFPRTMRDHEVAHFIARDVHARLDRLVESNAYPATRTLHLSFSSMTISKIGQLNHALTTKEESEDCKQWFILLSKGASEATIFGLPSMDMYMKSDESIADNMRLIDYDFKSSFKTRDGKKDPEDIYISLNMSLYSWLTILRKTFAREMDQVQAAAELQRGLTTSLSSGPISQRKKVPEPLSIIIEHSGPLKESPEPMPSALPPSSPSTPSREKPPSITQPVMSPTFPPQPGMSMTPAPEASQSMSASAASNTSTGAIIYRHRTRHIERLTMRQLGEATPDVMHPFFMKKAGFNLEDSLPQYVHEYATLPTEEIMKALLKLYSRQLKADNPEISMR